MHYMYDKLKAHYIRRLKTQSRNTLTENTLKLEKYGELLSCLITKDTSKYWKHFIFRIMTIN